MDFTIRRIGVTVCLSLALLSAGMLQTATYAAPKIDVAYYTALRQDNHGRQAERMTFIPTTDKAVSFAFGGFTRADSLDYILDLMEQNGIKGTFFVTERELRLNASNVAKIVAHGHEVGIGLRPGDKGNFVEYAAQIDRIRKKLASAYGIDARLVRQMYGPESDEIKEAVAATGCQLIGQTVNVIQTKYKDMASADQVMPLLFKRWSTSLGRGQIAYIRTDYTTSGTLPGDLMMSIKSNKIDNIAYRTLEDNPENNPLNNSAYRIDTIGNVLSNTAYLWKFPVDTAQIPIELRPGYVPVKVDEKNFNHEFFKRYVGSPDVTEDDRMLGFSRNQMSKADKSGVVKSVTDNTIFLTFDDWGNDNSINKLLYVLKKHNVTGTFFIITRSVPNDPNLLRAIALDGNEIGSHTNFHKAMAVRDPKTNKQHSTESEADFVTDVGLAYERLASYVGDVEVNGHHSLTRLFRPPTLAISKSGAMAVMNAGYTYMVSGFDSTEDYEALSVQQLVGKMQAGIYDDKGGVRKGSILVMHMSDTAKLTPQALDILLTANENKADNDSRKFKVGRLTNYLNGTYTQTMKVKKD